MDTKVLPGHGGGLIVEVIPTSDFIGEARAVTAVVNVAEEMDDAMVAVVGRASLLLLWLLLLLLWLSSLAGQLSGLTARHFLNNCPNKLTLPLVPPPVLPCILLGLVRGGGGGVGMDPGLEDDMDDVDDVDSLNKGLFPNPMGVRGRSI